MVMFFSLYWSSKFRDTKEGRKINLFLRLFGVVKLFHKMYPNISLLLICFILFKAALHSLLNYLIFTITDTKPCLWKNALRPLFLLFIRIITTKNTLMNSKLMEKKDNLTSMCRNYWWGRQTRSRVYPMEGLWNETEPKESDHK